MAGPRMHALEWRIAWRHLRAGERHPAWVDALTGVAVFIILIGLGFVFWAAHLGPAPEPGEQLFSAAVATAQQRQFGVFGGASIALGGMLLVLAALARFFNLLATLITMSVLLGCMALVVVLSLMSGLEVDLRDKILAQKAHMRVSGATGNRFTDYEELVEAISALDEVAGANPYLEAEIMVRSGINRQGAVLLGVQPERLLSVSSLAEIMREGSFESLEHPEDIPDPDPFGLSNTETPWRLRHLDKGSDSADDKTPAKTQPETKKTETKKTETKKTETTGSGSSLGQRRGLSPSLDLDSDSDSDEDEDEDGDAGDSDGDVGGSEAKGLSGVSLPPPPPAELFGRPGGGLPGPFGPSGLPSLKDNDDDDGDDEGWEDPVEALGIENGSGTKARAGDPQGEDDWGEGGDGWEDPSDVLELPDGQGDGADSEAGGDESGEDDSGEDESGEDSESVEGVVDPILLGRELANELAVGVGSRVQLITPVGRLTPAGRVPGILAAKVGGVFHSGMYEYDRKNVYIPLPVAQAFLRTGARISGIEVKLHDVDAMAAGKRAVDLELRRLGRTQPFIGRILTATSAGIESDEQREALRTALGIANEDGQLIVETWEDLNRNLFSAMFLEKIAMFVALLFVVLVASFGILASNLMSVLEKSKEIAILKAMGSQDQLILRVFVAEGLVLGVLGAVGGISVGLALCWALDTFGVPFNENVYYIERLPVVVNPAEVALVGVAALAIVWLSSIYPARVASRMRPIDGLRQQDK
ncbi:FtsX-like permease family protein [Pseudenhygromyxa sp. WMMC2535]|uniref:FtsX-like permease family protein n=1 Tax=Pseudenhygromyxa sp. WMMC2535 TaxID=2712867 RepID=UPI001551DBE4|nr:FtsX-like permease family protein [Pseudenhygromyxa sp. WMMC2535]NVB41581.1 FtsX-like permease family protein [Pseudenhygromyxa sp. WMMC2535]